MGWTKVAVCAMCDADLCCEKCGREQPDDFLVPTRQFIYDAIAQGNLDYQLNIRNQRQAWEAWKANGFPVGECPDYCKGTIVDTITDTVLAALQNFNSPVSHGAAEGAPRPRGECGSEPRRAPFFPMDNLPRCMMPDGGDCCEGYRALMNAWIAVVRDKPSTSLPPSDHAR